MNDEQTPTEPIKKGSLKEKIKASGLKRTGPVTRARAKTMTLIAQTKKIIDMLGPHLPDAVQVWIDGLKASHPVYVRGVIVDYLPDWKERRECANMIAAYVEGRPIERQMTAKGNFDDYKAVLENTRRAFGCARCQP